MKNPFALLLCCIAAVTAIPLETQSCLEAMDHMKKIEPLSAKFMAVYRADQGDKEVDEAIQSVQEGRDAYAEVVGYKFDTPLKEPLFSVMIAEALRDVDVSVIKDDKDREVFDVLKNISKEWRGIVSSMIKCPPKNDEMKKMFDTIVGYVDFSANLMKNLIDVSKLFESDDE